MVEFFNKTSLELFHKLSDLKYNVEIMEIHPDLKFVGLTISTDNLNINFAVLHPSHESYIPGKNYSLSIFDIDDYDLKNPINKLICKSLDECINMVMREDLFVMVSNPLCCPN